MGAAGRLITLSLGVSTLLLLRQITTNVAAENNMHLLSNRSRSQKYNIIMLSHEVDRDELLLEVLGENPCSGFFQSLEAACIRGSGPHTTSSLLPVSRFP